MCIARCCSADMAFHTDRIRQDPDGLKPRLPLTSPPCMLGSPVHVGGTELSPGAPQKFPCSKLKLDSLFLQWLAMPESQKLVRVPCLGGEIVAGTWQRLPWRLFAPGAEQQEEASPSLDVVKGSPEGWKHCKPFCIGTLSRAVARAGDRCGRRVSKLCLAMPGQLAGLEPKHLPDCCCSASQVCCCLAAAHTLLAGPSLHPFGAAGPVVTEDCLSAGVVPAGRCKGRQSIAWTQQQRARLALVALQCLCTVSRCCNHGELKALKRLTEMGWQCQASSVERVSLRAQT